jgi:predicted nucleic acid-binding Zn ribbon protein
VGASLDQAARRAGAPSAAVVEAVFSRWSEVVGPGISANAHPVSLAGGVLVVGASDPAWASQLRYLAGDLLARLEQVAGPGAVRRLEVRVRPGTGPSTGPGAHPRW